MTESTRDRLINVALEQFAERGFEGVSIARIADALDLSKQALLHHFSTKEKLYGEVLATISRDFEARIHADQTPAGDADALVGLFMALAESSQSHQDQTSLIMRELLDNRSRAVNAGHWYLKPFLDTLIDRLKSLDTWRDASREQALACVYQILGAINYFAISQDTLKAMFGQSSYEGTEQQFAPQLDRLIRSVIATGPGGEDVG